MGLARLYKKRTLKKIKEMILEKMPESFGRLYNEFNEKEKDVYLNLILYGNDCKKVSEVLKLDIKLVSDISDKINKYFLENIKVISKELGISGDEISDIINPN